MKMRVSCVTGGTKQQDEDLTHERKQDGRPTKPWN